MRWLCVAVLLSACSPRPEPAVIPPKIVPRVMPSTGEADRARAEAARHIATDPTIENQRLLRIMELSEAVRRARDTEKAHPSTKHVRAMRNATSALLGYLRP